MDWTNRSLNAVGLRAALMSVLLMLAACGGGKEDPQVLTAQPLGDMPEGRAIKLGVGQSDSSVIAVAELKPYAGPARKYGRMT